jgi:WD40 repeat protein
LWYLQNRGANKKLTGLDGPVNSVSFSPDGAMLAGGGNESVQLWNARTGISLRLLTQRIKRSPWRFLSKAVTTYNESIWVVAFSPDGKALLCGGGNNGLMVWDTATWKCLFYRIGTEIR